MTGFLEIVRAGMAPKGLSARPGQKIEDLPDELFLRLDETGGATGYCGHVDLGTGIRTALAQIIAEELDLPFAQATMVLGDTDKVPNQGATIASETIQVTAVPLRKAAAQARLILIRLAALRAGVEPEALRTEDGQVLGPEGGNVRFAYGELLTGQAVREHLDDGVRVKDPADYKIVGAHVPRVDIPDKVAGLAVYVHDVRVPGMLHGRVVRPPYGGWDHGPFFGRSLLAVDREAVAGMPGFVQLVVEGDFIAVVAEREEQAQAIAEALPVQWAPLPPMPDLSDIEEALRQNPDSPRVVREDGDLGAAFDGAPIDLQRRYLWPYQMHGSIGPSCAVAAWREGRLTVWSGTQNPHMLRADIALLTALPEGAIEIVRHEAAGCYGRNCADDVSGDAALLTLKLGRPVRVQLTREQEHVWEPKGAAQLMDVRGAADADGSLRGYEFSTRYPSNVSPLLSLVLTGIVPAMPVSVPMGDRTSVPPYDYGAKKITVHDMAPIARASWFRGVSAMPNSFAHDCFIDELAAAAREDPIAYRLKHLPDERAKDLLTAVAERAGWRPRPGPAKADAQARILRGRGAAYAQYVHGTFPGVPAAWSAWIADVEVDRATGQVAVTRVVVGQDSGMMVNPSGVRHQIEGNVIQSVSRALKEEVRFDETGVEAKEWGGYPILTFPEMPQVDVLMVPRQDQPPMGAGESASVPSAAAIANALYDATGVRFYELPFTPERVKARLDEALPLSPGLETPSVPVALPRTGRKGPAATGWARRVSRLAKGSALAGLAAGCAALGAFATGMLPVRAAIAPIAKPDVALFSQAAIERGRLVAAAGDCAVCHTAPGGTPMAGGLKLETAFGTIVTTNITPDVKTGIGAWSYPAFARAMREGIGRDGKHLYPAFPYPSFAKIDENDMQALYAYLMSLPPVRSTPQPSALKFPYNQRWLMAGWNTLFASTAPFTPDPTKSAAWNRGAYLVEGAGHCSACHTPRNALGAERLKTAYLGGGEAEGWDAPALSGLSRSPVPWTEQDVYDYLRTGFSARHGPAAGPMAPVVEEMRHLPDADVRAIAEYIASFDTRSEAASATQLDEAAAQRLTATAGASPGGRIFSGSCAACHEGEAPFMFGNRPSLALNSNLFAKTPDNLIRVILNGSSSALPGGGAMPAFGKVLNDRQLADLIAYLRETFAPGEPGWKDLPAHIAAIRGAVQ
ncbi:molybdopterin cofactor-binding domain-containing protein [Acidocella sp.]|uniref:molybdopterin cofactor-binding domain-containing protein n=1 Tax=Acidocella sp. TaxID=50710 RepID=UPI003D06D82E